MYSSMSGKPSDFLCSSSSSDSSSDSEEILKTAPIVEGKRCRNSSKRRQPIPKNDAPWQRMLDGYLKGSNTIGDEESRDGKYFRRRFRVPYSLYVAFIKTILDEGWFPKYGVNGEGPMDCTKTRGASLQVKVLSALRVLGRGCVFDEVFDGSGCGEESIRVFFHSFTSKCCASLATPSQSMEPSLAKGVIIAVIRRPKGAGVLICTPYRAVERLSIILATRTRLRCDTARLFKCAVGQRH